MMKFDYSRVKDPLYYAENRAPAHSDHICYRSFEEERLGQSSLRFSLDGIWKFFYANNEALVPENFVLPDGSVPGLDCHCWEDIHVPAHVQMEGHGRPQYSNVAYAWDGLEAPVPGELPESYNPTACYVRYFYVPETMTGNRIFISFQGAESGIAVWLNGQYIGYSENSFDPADFELTDALIDGENKLAVQVFHWTSSSWAEDQDFYRFSGLFRSVFLYEVPKVHIWDLTIRTDLSDELTEGTLHAFLKTYGIGRLVFTLQNEGQTVFSSAQQIGADGSAEEKEISCDLHAPKLWSAENPQLYDLLIDVRDTEGRTCEVIRQKVGFRRFEIRDSVMYLNGKRILFHGVNRHDFSSKRGRAITREEVLQDILTMKRNNINAIRTCHYPDVSCLYDLCDEYGLYLVAENNMETHGSWDTTWCDQKDPVNVVPGDRMNWLPMMLDRVTSCYERDKNHPSVLLWSVGNESYGGQVIYRMSERFRQLDPTRPVHYEGIVHDRRYNETSDTESRMYTPAAEVRAYLKNHRDKPFFMCEYTHAMGNSCGAMSEYTDLENEDLIYQGGFIWDYIDQSITTRNRFGNDYEAYGGDFDEHPNDGNFCGNGIVYGDDRSPSPKMQAVRYNYRMIRACIDAEQNGTLTVRIKNNYMFTNTDAFDAELILEKEGHEIRRESMRFAVGPYEEQVFKLPVRIPGVSSDPLSVYTGDGEYAATLRFLLRKPTKWADAGFEVTSEQAVFEVCHGRIHKLTARSWQEDILQKRCKDIGLQNSSENEVSPSNNKENTGTADNKMSSAEREVLRSLDMAGRYPEDVQHTCAGNELFHRYHLAEKNLAKPLRVVRGLENLSVAGENFRVMFAFRSGGLVSYRYAGREMLDAIPKPNFWRAPTDNDIGNMMPQRLVQWKMAGLYSTTRDAASAGPGSVPDIVQEPDRVTVIYHYMLPAPAKTECILAYTVMGDGTVLVRESLDIPEGFGTMPEFGVLFRMHADFDRICWYGLGPQETYADRMEGARLGIWDEKVQNAMARYLVPQESGAKLGVRWARIVDSRGRGLLFAGDRIMVSALPWSPHEIEQADHPYELPPVCHTYVRIAKGQMGIGGDDSWGAGVHSAFLLPGDGHAAFTFAFRGQ